MIKFVPKPKPRIPYQPKPRQPRPLKRMTICIAMLATDGIVLAADYQESDTYFKRPQQKIMTLTGGAAHATPTPVLPYCLAVAGAGESGFIDAFVNELFKHDASKQKNMRAWEKHCQSTLDSFYVRHVARFSLADPNSDFSVLIGVSWNGMSTILASHKSTLRNLDAPYEAKGIGSAFAKNLMGELWEPESVEENSMLAAYIVALTKETIENCGKHTDVVRIHNSVDGVLPKVTLSRMTGKSIWALENAFSKTLAPRQKQLVWKFIKEKTRRARRPI